MAMCSASVTCAKSAGTEVLCNKAGTGPARVLRHRDED